MEPCTEVMEVQVGQGRSGKGPRPQPSRAGGAPHRKRPLYVTSEQLEGVKQDGEHPEKVHKPEETTLASKGIRDEEGPYIIMKA